MGFTSRLPLFFPLFVSIKSVLLRDPSREGRGELGQVIAEGDQSAGNVLHSRDMVQSMPSIHIIRSSIRLDRVCSYTCSSGYRVVIQSSNRE